MSNYSQIFEILSVDDDSSNNRLEIISESLKENKQQLTGFGLLFDEQAEGINIKLDKHERFKVYKTKQDAITYLTEASFKKDILIIEDKKIWNHHEGDEKDSFIENINLWHQYKKLLTENIADYNNAIEEEFVLLSSDKGKLEIGFKNKTVECFSQNTYDKETFSKIQKTIIQNKDFIHFFKDAFIGFCSNQQKENRFSFSVNGVDIIYENANRNYNLYKNKFSFEEFSKGLEHAKDEYLKNYQLYLSEFLGKTSNLPIQVGVYLFLIYRFSDIGFILLILLVLIFTLSVYTFRDISLIIDNVDEMENNFNNNIQLIQDSSGLDATNFEETKEKVNKKIKKFVNLLKSYRVMNIAANFLFIVIIFYFLFCKYI